MSGLPDRLAPLDSLAPWGPRARPDPPDPPDPLDLTVLERAGFENRGGKGSHRNYQHPSGVRITIAGNGGQDAKRYQERDIADAIRSAKEKS